MNAYSHLSFFYDRLTTDVPYAAKAAYFVRLMKRFGLEKPGVVLDVACGSGNLTRELKKLGLAVVGVDWSEDMLALAAQKLPDVLFLRQDIRCLELDGGVDAAVCGMDGLNHLLSTADLEAALTAIAGAILPGGLLVFDANTVYKHRQVLSDNTFVREDETGMLVWQNRLNRRTNEVTMWLDFFAQREDGGYDRLSDEVRERAYSRATWEKLLDRAGFDLLAVYEDGSDRAPAADTERVAVAAKRR